MRDQPGSNLQSVRRALRALELISESGWKRELKTDAQGEVVVALPWRGHYVIEVEHLDATSGTLGSEAYESMRLVSTLSAQQSASRFATCG